MKAQITNEKFGNAGIIELDFDNEIDAVEHIIQEMLPVMQTWAEEQADEYDDTDVNQYLESMIDELRDSIEFI